MEPIGLVCYGRIKWAVDIRLYSVSSLEVQLLLDKITDDGILTNSLISEPLSTGPLVLFIFVYIIIEGPFPPLYTCR